MKALMKGFLARRKIVFIFLLAILIPAIILGYLSLRAFSERRQAVGQLLQSNLWMSGDSALRAVEAALLDKEKSLLATADIDVRENEPLGKAFLLDQHFQILFPKTGIKNPYFSANAVTASESGFSKLFIKAESYEFSNRDFAKAAQVYKESARQASSKSEKAIALAALGRCLISSGNLNEASSVYNELSTKYSLLKDQAGHFLGMTAAFQIYEIEKRRKRMENGLQTLLDLYSGLRKGEWTVTLSEYDFFTSEIESTIETSVQNGAHAEIADSYNVLKQQPSLYLQFLVFTGFLRKEAVPKIRDRIAASPFQNNPQPEPRRLLTSAGGQQFLISYSPFRNPDDRSTRYRGFCWDLESVKMKVLPDIFEKVSRDTGLRLDTADEENPASGVSNSLYLSYRQFPLPWKLHLIQPRLGELEQSARKENGLYGALLAFITILMFFGAILLGRDISRESETSRLRTEFVHNISHELKTPLTLIRLYAETLQRKKNLREEDRSESYEIITKESERLSHLINNVLDFSRIDMGRKEFKFKKDSLSSVVQETLESYRYHLEKKGFSINGQIDPYLPEMSFDAEAVTSILVNLLGNAMKFSADRKEVTVRLFRRDPWAVLQVEDKGIGIERKEQSEIFKRFYRVKQSADTQTQGSGLGLTLVKHITEAHSGAVEVESEPGKGSIFSILLPLSGSDEAGAQ